MGLQGMPTPEVSADMVLNGAHLLVCCTCEGDSDDAMICAWNGAGQQMLLHHQLQPALCGCAL